MTTKFNGPLHEMASTTPTQYLNDSCAVSELEYALARGVSGATSNPVIVLNTLKKEMHLWRERIAQIVRDHPTWHETRIAWQIYEELGLNGARMLLPVFEGSGGVLGRLSMQTDPAAYNDAETMLAQATYFAGLAPNIQVKIPCTSAGVSIIEEATFRGINLNVTVSFCVPQVLAIGDAIERGLRRREAAGHDVSKMRPYATMMVGRLDDWLKVVVKKESIVIDPAHLEWPGVAAFKRATQIFAERGYRTRMLSAAYRNFLHWTEFVGADVALTIPWDWQVKFNDSDVRPEPRMHLPVDPAILHSLSSTIPEFRRAYEPDGMSVREFDSFGATVRTLRTFISGWHDFVAIVRDFMLPDPDR
jgi:transaldolase